MNLLRAVVEDNKDPLKLGRVKVRIHTIHSDDTSIVKTSELPWAEVIGSTAFGLVGGIGLSSVLHQGTWVWVLLEQGDPNKPIIVGTISGVNSSAPDTTKGFNDPDGVFPFANRSTESDINEISRGTIQNTVIKTKNDNLDISDNYSEVAQSVSEYPNNTVLETESGHMIEMDDTVGNERVQIIDKNGNYIEMKVDEYIEKAVNHKINLIMGNLIEHISGGVKKQIDMDLLKTVSGYFELQADGHLQIINDVKIDGGLQVTGKITADLDITSKGEVADSQGNLSSLRDAYTIHLHLGNLGIPTSAPSPTDPLTRTSDFTWSSTPLGFK